MEHNTFPGNFLDLNLIVLFGVQLMVYIYADVFSQVYIVGIGVEAVAAKWVYDDLPFFNKLLNF
jgi:hypothetical protein